MKLAPVSGGGWFVVDGIIAALAVLVRGWRLEEDEEFASHSLRSRGAHTCCCRFFFFL